MSRPTPARPAAGDARGFVLVGVAMFILVLTILGLSLFSLSGFESQFFERSQRGSQTFYDALSGLDRARWVLITKDSLGLVGQSLPPGVIETKAYQQKFADLDSVGPIKWEDGEDVLIRVTATNNEVRQVVEARFSPTRAFNYYKRLMTLAGRGSTPDTALWIIKDNGVVSGVTDTRWSQALLEGKVWQNAASPSFLCNQYGLAGPFSWLTPGGVPDPDLHTYWDTHAGEPGTVTENFQSLTYDLDGTGGPNGVRFYKTDWVGGQWSLEFDRDFNDSSDTLEVNITVSGTVIWMIEGGLFSQRMIRVHGTGDALLVLVGVDSHADGHPNTELGLFAGLDSPTVPVVLVASHKVKLQHFSALHDTSATINYLSIFARSVELMGPSALYLTRTMTLRHEYNAAPDQPGGAVDRLYQLRLLPNMNTSQNRDLPMRLGTWYQVAQNN